MGRGDVRTRKGKISNGSYGVSRPHKTKTENAAPVAEVKKESKAKAKK